MNDENTDHPSIESWLWLGVANVFGFRRNSTLSPSTSMCVDSGAQSKLKSELALGREDCLKIINQTKSD